MGADDRTRAAGVTANAPAAQGQESLEQYMDQGSGIEAGRLARGEKSRWGKKASERKRQRVRQALQEQLDADR